MTTLTPNAVVLEGVSNECETTSAMVTILDEGTAVADVNLNAYHPSLICFDALNWLVTHDLGSSPDALDYHTRAVRTSDGGRTWSDAGRLLKERENSTHTIRTSRMLDGRLIGYGKLENRDGYTRRCNRETLGQAPMQLFWIYSSDEGGHWSEPCFISASFEGPTWELCHAIIELPDGGWAAPVATWRDWEGRLPNGQQTGILISKDQGISWPYYGRTFDGRKTGFIHWEQSIITMEDGSLVSVAWVFNPETGETLPNQFTRSDDCGRTFTLPQPTGFLAQTCKLLPRGPNLLCAVFRRHDQPGLWLEVAEICGTKWNRLERILLWNGAASGMHASGNVAENLKALRFGQPSMARLDNTTIALAYWRQEGATSVIHWMRIGIGA